MKVDSRCFGSMVFKLLLKVLGFLENVFGTSSDLANEVIKSGLLIPLQNKYILFLPVY